LYQTINIAFPIQFSAKTSDALKLLKGKSWILQWSKSKGQIIYSRS